jgi:hypothetical protein
MQAIFVTTQKQPLCRHENFCRSSAFTADMHLYAPAEGPLRYYLGRLWQMHATEQMHSDNAPSATVIYVPQILTPSYAVAHQLLDPTETTEWH